ncbi:hypothetical protein C2G38_2193948 [Gigaspora rosea]|uniref:Uncharacterized protein n=1 Tax=Gigaspora rosea TaxID=44941 RepID=A0A397UZM5_9GLOM|nr:hypothetical protein C2G38_2193948 [Gigaspora rosea]
MFDPNLPTFSSDLIYQLAQHIQQLQTSSSPNPFVPHQPLKKSFQYHNEVYCETSFPNPIIHPQSLQQQLFQDPQQYSRSQPTHRKLCFHCRRASHPILECPDIKRLGQKCNTLPKTLTSEQLEEFNEIINEIDNNKGTEEIVHSPLYIQVPPEEDQTTKLQQKSPTVTKVFNAYYIPDYPLEEIFNCAEFEPEEEKVVFELLQNLVAELDTLVQELAPKEIEPIREIKAEQDEYRQPIYNRKAPEMKTFEIIKKTAKMDHMDETFDSSLENSINVENEPPWNYQRPAKMDSKRKLDKLEKVNPKEKIVDGRTLGGSDCETLVENDNEVEEHLKEEASNYTCEELMRKVSEFKRLLEKKKNLLKSAELGNVTRKFMTGNCYLNGMNLEEQYDFESCSQNGVRIDKSEGTAFELDLKPIKSGFLDHIKSVIETKIENNNMWFKNQFDGSMVKIKESVNKSIFVAHRIDSNKEKEVEKGVGSQAKEYVTNHNL